MVVIISSIPIQSLRNAEVIQFNIDVLKVTQRSGQVVLKVKSQYDAFFQSNQVLSDIFKKDAASPITVDITLADARRNDAINGISAVVSGYVYHFDATINIAANLINNHLLSYGTGISRLNYQSKTLTLTSIFEDWTDLPDLTAAIIFLKLDDWKDEMGSSNNAFNDLYIDRTQNMADSNDASMKTKRLECASAYYDLRNKLNAYAVISEGADAEPYIKVINDLNALIDQYNRLLANRGGGPDAPPAPPSQQPDL